MNYRSEKDIVSLKPQLNIILKTLQDFFKIVFYVFSGTSVAFILLITLTIGTYSSWLKRKS